MKLAASEQRASGLFAEHWKGTAWSVQPTPTPAETQGKQKGKNAQVDEGPNPLLPEPDMSPNGGRV